MKTKKAGFTLMEMLIVVAIIAIVAVIAVPTFSVSLVKAKESADIANIRSAFVEAQIYKMNEYTVTFSQTSDKELLIDFVSAGGTSENKTVTLNYPDKLVVGEDGISLTYNATEQGVQTWSLAGATSSSN